MFSMLVSLDGSINLNYLGFVLPSNTLSSVRRKHRMKGKNIKYLHFHEH